MTFFQNIIPTQKMQNKCDLKKVEQKKLREMLSRNKTKDICCSTC